jgi:hypothetical protein
MEKIALYAPDDSPITGIKLVNGEYAGVSFSYSKSSGVSILEVDNEKEANWFVDQYGEKILKDINGKEWPSSDVEFYSLGRR